MNNIIVQAVGGKEVIFNLYDIFNENVMINATKIAKQFNKRVPNWIRTDETKDYIEALEAQNAHMSSGAIPDTYVNVVNGGNQNGTWLHQDLAIIFARWLSPSFAVALDIEIKAIILEEDNRSSIRETNRYDWSGFCKAVKKYCGDNDKYFRASEIEMINKIAIGKTSHNYKIKHNVDSMRDDITSKQGERLNRLVTLDIGLLKGKIPFKKRKKILKRNRK